jgi:hypothetical protein
VVASYEVVGCEVEVDVRVLVLCDGVGGGAT